MTFKQGKPEEKELWTLAKHILKFWKQLGRVLGIEGHILDEIEVDHNSHVYEQSLEMLTRWWKSKGSHATYGELGKALVDPSIDRYDLMVMTCCPDTDKEKVPLSVSFPEEVDEDENVTQQMGRLCIQKSKDLRENSIYPKAIPSVSILLGEPFHETYQREKELRTLKTLYNSLDCNNTCNDVKMVYVTGPPGSGKTQLSRLYSKWYGQQSFPSGRSIVVATLHAETAEALLESYIELTSALGITMEEHDRQDDIKKKLQLYSKTIKNLFQKNNLYNFDWLVVVDNVFATNPLKEYWPLPGNGWGNGRVIVTTQDSELAPSAHTNSRTLSLSEGMDKDDAIDFLCLISELERDESCAVVAEKLNYYPLSLACAAVFVRDMRHERPAANFSWNDYLANLKRYFELLKYSEFTDHNICYPRSMLTAAVCSASRMAESSSVLRSAFKFLSFCTIQPIPLDLVSEAVMQSMDDEIVIPDELKKKLARCSLLSYPRHGVRGVEVVTMHQVVRTAFVQLRKVSCKDVADSEACTVKMVDDRYFMGTLETMCQYYHRRFQTLEEQAIHTKILLSPHLQDMINAAKNLTLTHNEAFIDGSVCFADSLIHVEGGTDHHRVQLLEAAYNIQKKLNLKSLCACRLLGDLGYTYREAGRLDDVIPVLEEAIIIAEQHEGLEWMKQRSKILNILGWTYREMYQLDLASAYMLMSVDVTKQAYGDQHDEVIERLCNYGIILNDSWKNLEAIEVMEEAQRIVEALGTDKSVVRAQVANYTAKIYLRAFLGVYYSEGLTKEARDLLAKSKTLHEKALDIYEHLHGKEHKFYLGTAMTYATVLCHVGQADIGQAFCEEAVRVYRSSGHFAWPRVATILADIYLVKGMFSDAKRLLEEAIQGLNEFGVDKRNPRIWLPHARLAEALINTGEPERGIALLKQCLNGWNDLHPEHYWVVRARKILENVPSF